MMRLDILPRAKLHEMAREILSRGGDEHVITVNGSKVTRISIPRKLSIIAKEDAIPGSLTKSDLKKFNRRLNQTSRTHGALLSSPILRAIGILRTGSHSLFRQKRKESGKLDDVSAFVRSSYLGGRSEVLRVAARGDLREYDFESAYPSQLLKPVPVCAPEPLGYIGDAKASLVHCQVLSTESWLGGLPYRERSSILFPTDCVFTGVWWDFEIKSAEELGLVEVLNTYGGLDFHLAPSPWKREIQNLLEIKKEGGGVGKIAKMAATRMLGVLGSRGTKSTIVKSPESRIGLYPIDPEHDIWGKTEPAKEQPYHSPVVSSYVNAKVRTSLTKCAVMAEANGERPVMLCTDAIWTQGRSEAAEAMGLVEKRRYTGTIGVVAPGTYYVQHENGYHARASGVSVENPTPGESYLLEENAPFSMCGATTRLRPVESGSRLGAGPRPVMSDGINTSGPQVKSEKPNKKMSGWSVIELDFGEEGNQTNTGIEVNNCQEQQDLFPTNQRTPK